MITDLGRREFISSLATMSAAAAFRPRAARAQRAQEAKRPKLRLAFKYDMIKIKGSAEDKLNLAKKLGMEGVEVDSPGSFDKDELKAASQKTGIKIHGVIDSVHWRDTLSDPDERVRAKGLAALRGAIEDAAFFESDTVLLVPGVVKGSVTYEQCYERSQAEIKKVLPLAAERKIKILIETVGNNFITKPEQMISFVNDLASPWAGAYFDCSNMIRHGVSSAEWIRRLGKMMVKFDFKGFSKAKGRVPIGEGDEDWPEVLKALGEIGYDGWATSEVSGGGEAELADIAARMKRVLGVG
jgi:L-ribulose-5-phosphate 3-epimerase